MKDLGFATYLLREGALNADQHRAVAETMGLSDRRADTVVLDLGLMSEATLLQALGRYHRTRPVTAIELASVGEELARMISPRIARRYEIVPFRSEGRKLYLASLNPENLQIEDELGLMTGLMVTSFVGLEVRVYEALSRLYGLEMPPLVLGVSKRLATGEIGGVRPRGAHQPVHAHGTRREVHDLDEPLDVLQRRTTAERTARAEASARELEISAEDLELFPSLRHEVEAGAEPEEEPSAAVEAAAPPVRDPGDDTATRDSSPEGRLARASVLLENAEMREDIADALLGFCTPYFRRRMTLTLHKDQIIGWRGAGDGVDPAAVKAISIPTTEPTVFSGLLQGTTFWLGRLPPMPRNLDLLLGLGDDQPKECVIFPITLRKKPVCFLYGDNGDDGVGAAPIAHLRRLVAKAGIAFEVYLLKSKIRTL